MKFYTIAGEKNLEKKEHLQRACSKKGIEFIDLIDMDFLDVLNLNLQKGDLFYRISKSEKAQKIQKIIMNEKVSTFYKNFERSVSLYPGSYLMHRKFGLPIPKTIELYGSNPKQIKKYVDQLNGFPVVLKVIGGDKGIGVIKVDSLDSLLSLYSYLNTLNISIILREFVEIEKPVASYRAVVLGKKIVFSYKNQSTDMDDFRSNVDQNSRNRVKVEIDEKNKNIIVKAFDVMGFEFGALDFVYDKNGDLKIFEVNFPFNFVPIIEDLDFDIASKMLEYLIEKSKKLNS